MDLDPRRLRVFLAVIRAEGVVGAARVLHLTPQAVSQQVSALEGELGVQLFDRSRRRLAPSAAGLILAAHAERIEAELLAAGRAVAAATGRASGAVRIAAFYSAIRWLVVEALPLVREAAPGVAPSVIELDGPGVIRALRTGEVDLVVDERDEQAEDPGGRGLAVHLLRRDPYRVVAPVSLARTLRTPRALAGVPWIGAPPHTACHAAMQRLARRAGGKLELAHVCREFPSVLALVAAGEGVAILPELALQDARGVEPCPIDGLGARKLICIQRSSQRGTEPAVDAVVRVLRRAS